MSFLELYNQPVAVAENWFDKNVILKFETVVYNSRPQVFIHSYKSRMFLKLFWTFVTLWLSK